MTKMVMGGTERSILNLLDTLDPEKYDVTLLLLEKGGALFKDIPSHIKVDFLENYNQINFYRKNNPIQIFISLLKRFKIINAIHFLLIYIYIKLTGKWYKMTEYSLRKVKVINDNYNTVVAFPGPCPIISYLVLYKVKGQKKIQWIHSDVSKTFNDLGFGDKFYHLFNKICCVSEDAKNIFIKKYPKCKDVTVFENIINEQKIIESSLHGESFFDNFDGVRILTVGRISHEKGIDFIPEIVEKLKSKGYVFRWYIIGDGNMFSAIKEEIKKRKIENFLSLLGTKLNPYTFMRDCDIYVQPSRYEGFGISVAEAKILKKPIIITNFTNSSKLITDGYNGLIAEITPNDIYKKINILINNTTLANQFVNNLSISEESNNISTLNKLKTVFNRY